MQTPTGNINAIQGRDIQTSMVMSAFETLKTGNPTADVLISFLLVNLAAFMLTKVTSLFGSLVEWIKQCLTVRRKVNQDPSMFNLVLVEKEEDKYTRAFNESDNTRGMLLAVLDYVSKNHLEQIKQASGKLVLYDKSLDTERETYLAYQTVLVPNVFNIDITFKDVKLNISYDESTTATKDKDNNGQKSNETQSSSSTTKKTSLGTIIISVPMGHATIAQTFVDHCWQAYVNRLYPQKVKGRDPLSYFSPAGEEFGSKPEFSRLPLDNRRTFDALFFPNKQRVLQVLTDFMHKKGTFANPNIPWKLGILLYGPPGCGKTTFIKALANFLWRSVQSLDLRAIKNNTQLHRIFFHETIDSPNGYSYSVKQDKKIIICEDFDAGSSVMKKRVERVEEEKKEDKMEKMFDRTFDLSAFLNTLDGVYEPVGLAYIFTTNRKEYVDPAIIRPGRITIEINLTYMVKENICEMLNMYFPTAKITEKDIPDQLDGKYTPAQIEQTCQMGKTIPEVFQLLSKIPPNAPVQSQ